MDFNGMGARDIVEIISNKRRMKLTDDDWLAIQDWITDFLNSNPPDEEKKLFVPFGWAEMVTIMCDGITRRRNAICTQCRKENSLRECEIYGNKIPKEIWTTGKDAVCDYFEHK